MFRSFATLLILGVMLWALGCGSSDNSGGAASGARSMDELAATLDKPQQSPQAATTTPPGTAAVSAQPAPPPPSEQPTTGDTTTVAGSATLGQGGGYYSAIAGARRHISHRVESLAWTQAVQHFKAQEGRLPKDHEEFMSKVVAPLEIDLGFIEEDQEFLYDPSEGEWGTLYVVSKDETPAPAQ